MGSKQTTQDGPPPLTAAAVRSVARALEGILVEIQGGESFQRTRMTRVKRLCRDQAAAEAFARFIAGRALLKLEGREQSSSVPAERWGQLTALARDGVARLDAFLADRSPETERILRAHRHALYQAQSEYQHIPYGAVRLIVCWEALQVEQALAAKSLTVIGISHRRPLDADALHARLPGSQYRLVQRGAAGPRDHHDY